MSTTEQRHPTVRAIGADLVLANGRVRLPGPDYDRWKSRLLSLRSSEREAVAVDLVALALDLGRVFSRAAEFAIDQLAKLAATAAAGRDQTKDPQAALRKAARALGMNIGASYVTPSGGGKSILSLRANEMPTLT